MRCPAARAARTLRSQTRRCVRARSRCAFPSRRRVALLLARSAASVHRRCAESWPAYVGYRSLRCAMSNARWEHANTAAIRSCAAARRSAVLHGNANAVPRSLNSALAGACAVVARLWVPMLRVALTTAAPSAVRVPRPRRARPGWLPGSSPPVLCGRWSGPQVRGLHDTHSSPPG